MRSELAGRLAIVTGAGSGIGRAAAHDLAAAGALVVCTDLDTETAEETAEALRVAGSDAVARSLDVTDIPAFRASIDAVHRRYGRIDVLANVAGGVTARGPVADLSEDHFHRGLALNLTSMVFGCQAAARVMRAGSSIVNIASGTVDAAVGDLPAYSIPKAGILQLTRSLARELGPAGIRVNAISPGYIRTGMTADHDAELIERRSADIPLGRAGSAHEVAAVITFLASERASYVTGQVIRVNGGSVMPL
ncbi:SDR family NAD(P)-dependent oxidoreductase [Nocardia sp. NPDC003963]